MEWVLITVAILVIVALALPYIIKAKINAALKKMDGYTGRIDGLQMNIVTGRLTLTSVIIHKKESIEPDPMIRIPELIVSFRLLQLLKKNLDLKVIVNAPEISLLDDRVSPPVSQDTDARPSNISSKLRETITTMMPFRLNAEIHDATVRYKKGNPSLDLSITQTNVIVTDFSNHPDQTKACVIETNGLLNEGTMSIVTNLFPMAPELTLDVNVKLTSVNLVPFNNLIKAYAKVDINTGTLDFFAEIGVANNSFDGYIKPILTELDFIGVQDKNDSLLHKVWERIVAGGVKFLMNRRDHQLATTIPIRGRLDEPEVNAVAALAGLIRNAFFKALRPSVEDLISVGSPRRTNDAI
jgi:hypothetical protein